MCGRFASPDEEEIVETFDVTVVKGSAQASGNVAPTEMVSIVVDRVKEDQVVRKLRLARWGLVPSWTKTFDKTNAMFNARAETVLEKPSFRTAAVRRRAIVPAWGYYEWVKNSTSRSTPYFLHPSDDSMLGLAGLYEWWKVPEGMTVKGASDDGWLCSVTIMTRSAADEIGQIHDRMPVVVPLGLLDEWLDPTLTDSQKVEELITAMPDPVLVPTPRSPMSGDIHLQERMTGIEPA